MAKKNSQPMQRRLRRDAQRNRERILEVAKEAFTRFGANASLDEIAKQAAVGAGTLYRHFPARDALIEAVYRSEVEKLSASARKLAQTMPPLDARGPGCCSSSITSQPSTSLLPLSTASSEARPGSMRILAA
jgi:AcrR family transcriptional regulator